MTVTGVLVLLFFLGLGALATTTLLIAVRGGRGPGDPPASHARVDPAGFPVLPAPRPALELRRSVAAGRSARPGRIRTARRFRFRSARSLPMQG
ncbi:hypothetical protein [Blastococcus sp. SYSU D00820]